MADNAEYYAQLVQRKASFEQSSLLPELAREGQEGQRIIFLGEASEKFREIENRSDCSYTPHVKLLSNFEYLEALSENPQDHRYPNWFTELDELTRGLQRGDLIILAARPSMGNFICNEHGDVCCVQSNSPS